MEVERMKSAEKDEGNQTYSIKEASELTDVAPHTIRYWERKLPGFLCPARTSGGQRRFTEECLGKIRKLDYYVNHRGMTPVGAKRMIDDGVEPENGTDHKSKNKIFGDDQVRQAVDEILGLVRKRILEQD
jgi:DNA-binding transcriptional MerR regulator